MTKINITATNTIGSQREMGVKRPQESQPQPNTYRGRGIGMERTRAEPSITHMLYKSDILLV